MKLIKFLFVFLSLNLMYGMTVSAAQVGVLQLAGTGCDVKVGPNKLTPVKGVRIVSQLPFI